MRQQERQEPVDLSDILEKKDSPRVVADLKKLEEQKQVSR